MIESVYFMLISLGVVFTILAYALKKTGPRLSFSLISVLTWFIVALSSVQLDIILVLGGDYEIVEFYTYSWLSYYFVALGLIQFVYSVIIAFKMFSEETGKASEEGE